MASIAPPIMNLLFLSMLYVFFDGDSEQKIIIFNRLVNSKIVTTMSPKATQRRAVLYRRDTGFQQ